MKNLRGTTRGIKNCLVSRLFKGYSPLQLLCNLIGKPPAVPYWPYRQRYAVRVKTEKTDKETWKRL